MTFGSHVRWWLGLSFALWTDGDDESRPNAFDVVSLSHRARQVLVQSQYIYIILPDGNDNGDTASQVYLAAF